MAGALLVTTLTATAVGLATTAHADDAPAPNVQVSVPAPAAPWIPNIDTFPGRWHVHCGFPGWQGPFQCWY